MADDIKPGDSGAQQPPEPANAGEGAQTKTYSEEEYGQIVKQKNWSAGQLRIAQDELKTLKSEIEELKKDPKNRDTGSVNKEQFEALKTKLTEEQGLREQLQSKLKDVTVRQTVFSEIGDRFASTKAFDSFWREFGGQFEEQELDGKSKVIVKSAPWSGFEETKKEFLKTLESTHDFLLKNPGNPGTGNPQKGEVGKGQTPGPNASKAEWKEYFDANPDVKLKFNNA